MDHGFQADYINEEDPNGNTNNNNSKDLFEVTKENSSDSNFSDVINDPLQTSKENNIFKGDPPKLFEMKTLTLANILIMENATNGIIIIIIIITNNIIYKSFSFYWYAKGENVNKETEITVE